jgi:hypothetical protein
MRISIFQVDQDKPQVVSKTGGFTVLLSVQSFTTPELLMSQSLMWMLYNVLDKLPVGLRYLIDSGQDCSKKVRTERTLYEQTSRLLSRMN